MAAIVGRGNNFQDQEEEGVQKGHEFFRVMRLFDKKPILYLSFFLSLCSGASPLIFLIPMKEGCKLFGSPDFMGVTVSFIKKSAWALAIIIVIECLSMTAQNITSPLFLVDIRRKLYSSLLDQDIAYFDKTSTGAQISRLSEGVAFIRDVYVDTLYLTIKAVALAIAGLVVALVEEWLVTFEMIAFPIAIALVLFGGNKWANKIWDQYKAAGTESTEKAVEIVTEFRTVKSFDNEMYEADQFENNLYDEDKILRKVSIVRGLTYCLALLILGALGIVLAWYTLKLLVENPMKYTLYSLLTVSCGMVMLTLGIDQILTTSDDFKMASLAARNIIKIINTKPTIDRKLGQELDNVVGDIEFKNVAFKYQGSENYALKNLSFKINAGETVAFVGESGCGKSTTLQLLQRFYDIVEGQILIDGVDIREISPRCLRSFISIVPQSPVLFSMSISENIKYGKESETEEHIAQAAQAGNAHNFIMELPENYKTVVQQTSLSGGQKQRICISRAILAKTPILLLDEATAALDTESEQLVQQSLENFRHGKTSIMVAHRLATVVNADRIFVFQEGHIAETGTHKELLEANGIYADLAKYQLQ
ncbi:ABC transporter family protein [Tritrichomonas foetus]|uniref:ABC transporter family protein n=1 Tax=Tritrichomonas foetus TaxID=1144522 RepID=A0A1J4J4C6_9EUKA|nr:ABC transporter family protein [Tritrichomonas foetus]|eukprot:OHS94222.1 ABC transporter family protein [Tritrichomonas foetus]